MVTINLKRIVLAITLLFSLSQSSPSINKSRYDNVVSLSLKRDSVINLLWKIRTNCDVVHDQDCRSKYIKQRSIMVAFRESIDSIQRLRNLNPDSTVEDSGKYYLHRILPFRVILSIYNNKQLLKYYSINGDTIDIYIQNGFLGEDDIYYYENSSGRIEDSKISYESYEEHKKKNPKIWKSILRYRKVMDPMKTLQIANAVLENNILELNKEYINFDGDDDELRLIISQNTSTKKVYTLNCNSYKAESVVDIIKEISESLISHRYPIEILPSDSQEQFYKNVVQEFNQFALDIKTTDKNRTVVTKPRIESIRLNIIDTNKIATSILLKKSDFWEQIGKSITKKFNPVLGCDDENDCILAGGSFAVKRNPFNHYEFVLTFKDKSKLVIDNEESINTSVDWNVFLMRNGKEMEYELPYEAMQDLRDYIIYGLAK